MRAKKKTEAHEDPEGQQCGEKSRNREREPNCLPIAETSFASAEDPKQSSCLQDVRSLCVSLPCSGRRRLRWKETLHRSSSIHKGARREGSTVYNLTLPKGCSELPSSTEPSQASLNRNHSPSREEEKQTICPTGSLTHPGPVSCDCVCPLLTQVKYSRCSLAFLHKAESRNHSFIPFIQPIFIEHLKDDRHWTGCVFAS